MRVLIVSQEYPPETGWGGIGSYVHILAHALAGRGAEVHVLSVARGLAEHDVRDGDVHVHRRPLRTPRGVGRALGLVETYDRLSVAWSAWRAARRLGMDFDVIHCPQWRAEGYFFVRRRQAPVVVYLHSLTSQIMEILGDRSRDAWLAARLEESTVRRAGLVASPRRHAETVAARLGVGEDRLRIVPNPVRPAPPAPAPPPGPPYRVLFCGRYEPRKGPETIVRAAPLVLAEHPGTRFVFVGRDSATREHPSYRQWLERLAGERSIGGALEFVDGWQDGAVERETARAHLCVVPSLSESFGYVAAEASTAGRPVVASRVGGLAEVVEDGVTGFLAHPRDERQWGEAIARILRDPALARSMGDAGRRMMAERFHPDVVAAQMIEVYREAAGRAPDARAAVEIGSPAP